MFMPPSFPKTTTLEVFWQKKKEKRTSSVVFDIHYSEFSVYFLSAHKKKKKHTHTHIWVLKSLDGQVLFLGYGCSLPHLFTQRWKHWSIALSNG